MIPVFWRYSLRSYLKIFSLSVASIVSMLIVVRFKEIARFAVLSNNWSQTALFTLYQIPFILPMAIPISALVASFLFIQRMSRSSETGALRAAGLSLRDILAPLLFVGAFLSLVNFAFSAKITPLSNQASLEILTKDSENPLALLQKRKLFKLKNTYLQWKADENELLDLILIARSGSSHRLGLLACDRLVMENNAFKGERLVTVSHPSAQSENFDSLLIENQAVMNMEASSFLERIKKRGHKITIRSLDFRMLAQSASYPGRIGRAAMTELLRRCSLAIAVLSFTFLGCAFGFEAGKNHSKSGSIQALFLALVLFSSYFLGKGLRFNAVISTVSFILPHCLVWICSLWRLRKISRGWV